MGTEPSLPTQRTLLSPKSDLLSSSTLVPTTIKSTSKPNPTATATPVSGIDANTQDSHAWAWLGQTVLQCSLTIVLSSLPARCQLASNSLRSLAAPTRFARLQLVYHAWTRN